MPILPLFTFCNPHSAEKHILSLIQYIQGQGGNIRLSIRSSVNILSGLDNALQQQLIPFISSGRIHIFPDSSDASFQGLMNIRDLQSHLESGAQAFSRLYPDLPAVFIPHWHDYYREEARKLYRLGTVLFPVVDNGLLPYYRLLQENDERRYIVPIVSADNVRAGQSLSRLHKEIHKSRRMIANLMSRGRLRKQDSWDTMIMIDGDRFSQDFLDMFTFLAKRKHTFASGRGGFQFLRVLEDPTREESVQFATEIKAASFDPPYFGPEFIAQLFPDSRQESQKMQSFSAMLPLPTPQQRVETAGPDREMSSNLLSRAMLYEEDFVLMFIDGNIVEMRLSNNTFAFASGIASEVRIQKGRHKQRYTFEIENAFAVGGGLSRGLRQTLTLNIPAAQISGRITNDFLIIGDRKELYLDSYIQHPWIYEGYSLRSYIPQMLMLWAGLSEDTSLILRSQNSDGTERMLNIHLSDIRERESVFLPGTAWILNCGNSQIGMDLVYGRESGIHLPSVVLIERLGRKGHRVSFLPTAEYINPDIKILNGLLEHYTLRIMPNVSRFEDFRTIEQGALEHIAKPFIVYF